MKIALAIFLGLVWGAMGAVLGGFVTRWEIRKNKNGTILAGNLIRTLIDLSVLGLVFLLRNVLPFDYSYMLIAAAVALSIGTIFISFRLARK